MSSETLYDRLGGRDAIEAVVDEFSDRVLILSAVTVSSHSPPRVGE
ncbi:hypothetical protein [Haloplanus halobius]